MRDKCAVRRFLIVFALRTAPWSWRHDTRFSSRIQVTEALWFHARGCAWLRLVQRFPPQSQRFSLPNVLWLLDTRKGAITKILHIFCCLQMTTVSKDDAGVTRGTVFQEVRPGAGFKNGDFVTEKLGWLP